jgi:hypothetical protein
MWRRAATAASWFVVAVATSGCNHEAPCVAEEAGADAAAASDAGSGEAAAALPCNAGGSWTVTEVGCACGDCDGIGTTVGFLISPQVAAEGGTFVDSDESTWSFDPATCTATLGGDCDASDIIDFAGNAVTCSWTCQSMCPPCPATCKLQHQ